jgi:hypothetical protein
VVFGSGSFCRFVDFFDLFGGFFLFFFWLCTSLFSGLALGIVLLHMLGLIDIYLISYIPFIKKIVKMLELIFLVKTNREKNRAGLPRVCALMCGWVGGGVGRTSR